jgi:hypothetical protein
MMGRGEFAVPRRIGQDRRAARYPGKVQACGSASRESRKWKFSKSPAPSGIPVGWAEASPSLQVMTDSGARRPPHRSPCASRRRSVGAGVVWPIIFATFPFFPCTLWRFAFSCSLGVRYFLFLSPPWFHWLRRNCPVVLRTLDTPSTQESN